MVFQLEKIFNKGIYETKIQQKMFKKLEERYFFLTPFHTCFITCELIKTQANKEHQNESDVKPI